MFHKIDLSLQGILRVIYFSCKAYFKSVDWSLINKTNHESECTDMSWILLMVCLELVRRKYINERYMVECGLDEEIRLFIVLLWIGTKISFLCEIRTSKISIHYCLPWFLANNHWFKINYLQDQPENLRTYCVCIFFKNWWMFLMFLLKQWR